ncbi:DUF2933 domain-containing protein [Demequina capsici]|uniref:DUF2933 domain-containing protein n=1 Tax=Demequina capsici TaxID=3075620 RepID=A0AA96J679_9MICO|nr:DUF2933 domain-containing protein [Demequina sp. OYTSA14]WNM23937.1 DUF2933 domain-containing protein [Demequina sp. OYTSA14]
MNRRLKVGLIAGTVIIAALVVAGVDIVRYLPFAIFALCPLMMFFMMRSHGHGGMHGHTQDSEPQRGDARTGGHHH